MGDAGEGLIDTESRLQERREELERAKEERRARDAGELKPPRAEVESLRLARVELERQLAATTHEQRLRSHLLLLLADRAHASNRRARSPPGRDEIRPRASEPDPRTPPDPAANLSPTILV